jgi:hypothetical protein
MVFIEIKNRGYIASAGCGEKGTVVYKWWKYKLAGSLWKAA